MKKFPSRTPEMNITFLQALPGLLLGLMYAFAFYGIFYVTRETFRLLSISWDYHIYELSPGARHFSNFLFAFTGMLVGQSFCFGLWFDKPKRFFGSLKYRRVQVVADHINLLWFYLSWFSKLALIYGIYFGVTMHDCYGCMPVYPDYYWLFALIMTVLFLNQWIWFRIINRNKALKWMAGSAAIFLALSFGLSRIELVDYQKINASYAKYNLEKKYKLEYPESRISTLPGYWSLREYVYVGFHTPHVKDDQPVIVVDYEEITLDELSKTIRKWQSERDEIVRRHLQIILNIDRDVPLKMIKQIEDILANKGIRQVSYRVFRSGKPGCGSPPPYVFVHKFIRHMPVLPPGFEKYVNAVYHSDRPVKIMINDKGDVFLDDKIIAVHSLVPRMVRIMEKNPDFSILYYPSEKTTFGSYFMVLSDIRLAFREVRDEYSMSKFGKPYDELLEEYQFEDVQEKFPFRMIEPDDLHPEDKKSFK